MCGITGVYNLKNQQIDYSLITKMTGQLAHRGPDDEGLYVRENIGLGHRRLSIIDLSEKGHQPMQRGNLVIVYNGEVYNYIELRKELEQKGYVFSSNTDTEVVLFAFKEWGKDCLKRFNGMWAFAIWDKEKKELFCSRDRYGIKPFYYYFDGTNFAFASEIRPLLSCSFIKKIPNKKAVYEYLTTELADYSDQTFFKDIKQLEPSRYLLISENSFKIEKYYQLSCSLQLGKFSEEKLEEYSQRFLELLKDSIRLRLRSDVPVGSCLSGGLDSSIIVSLINKIRNKGQETFSFYSQDPKADEKSYIEEIIKGKEIRNHHIYCSNQDFWQDIRQVVQEHEEPFKSTSVYAQWKVMSLAKKNGVKVLLDGQGADEIFGYPEQIGSYLNQALLKGKLAGYDKTMLSNLFRLFLPPKAIFFLRKRKIKSLNFLNPQFEEKHEYREIGSNLAKINFQQALFEGVTGCGLRRLLRYEDKNSMAFSIESRIPFLDYRLVDFVFSIPAVYKVHDGFTKYLVRASAKGLIPERVRLRKNKLGFATEESWLGDNKENIIELFKKGNFLSEEYVSRKKMLEELAEKNTSISQLWRFINLELWLKEF